MSSLKLSFEDMSVFGPKIAECDSGTNIVSAKNPSALANLPQTNIYRSRN